MGIPLCGSGFTLSLSLSLSNWCCRITLDDFLQKPDRIFVFNPLLHNTEEYGVIYAVEEFSDIAFEHETIRGAVPSDTAGFTFQEIDAFVRTKPDAAGKRCRNERFLKNRIQNGKYCMMQNAIADFGFMDMALLRVMDIKAIVRPVAIRSVFQIAMKLKNALLEMPLKLHHVGLVPFVFLESFPCGKKIFGGNDAFEKVAVSFHECYG